MEEYVAYTRLINEADAVWHKAKEQNDYNSFAPYIDKIVSARKRNAFLVSPEMDPYDYQYSDGPRSGSGRYLGWNQKRFCILAVWIYTLF